MSWIRKRFVEMFKPPVEPDEVLTPEELGPDPNEVTVEHAYKTRWIWYHTLLALELLLVNVLLIAILVTLAVKL